MVVAALVLAACSTGTQATPASSDSVAVTTTTAHPDDGALVIGAILPTSGIAADLGASMKLALEMGVQEINSSGGVNGRPVRLVTGEEGDNSATAGLAVQSLAPRVDAIIGPTSSINTLGTLGAAVDAGVLTCSPTASALALDEFPDDGLFFRTIASDSLQAAAIASLVEASGSSAAVIVYLDDGYGRPFATAAQRAMAANGTRVSAAVAFTATEDGISAAVDQVLAAQPEVVAIIADGASGPDIITAIDAAGPSSITYVVNDAIRRPVASAQPFGPQLASRVIGVSPLADAGAQQFDEALTALNADANHHFAHNAYDCLAVIALAAQSAGSSQPRDIASSVSTVTTSGTRCSAFVTCSTALLDGRNINYNGPSGNLTIDADGNVTTAIFERFTFDDTGRDVPDGSLTIGSD